MSGNIRQELYDRIRESSKDEVILEEMIRLGFWPTGTGQPSAPEDLIRRNGELSRELSELYKQQAQWADPARALKEMHKQRKRAAMERRKETKLRHARERHERALAWAERRNIDVLYLGEGVSGGLTGGAEARTVQAPGLPPLANAKALASAIGVPLAELRFLAYERALSRVSHYQRFLIPKKSGGHRQISAPMPRLKRAQYWILDNILAKVPVHEAAHGFAPDRSILSNAAPHVGRDVVVNLDLKDFFPTLVWRRVRGKFRGLGYSEAVATLLALICTEPDVDEVELDGQRLFLRKGQRRLPQGAPTSPALTNLICLRLDKRLAGLAAKLGFTYTRYADDMTFSASGEAAGRTGTLLKAVQDIVGAEGFTVHPDKTRIMRKHRRQEVTGLVVNSSVNVPRDTLRRFRALLHQIEKTGPEGKRWGKGGNVLVAALGFAHFVRMVDAEAGAALVAKVGALAGRHGVVGPQRFTLPAFRGKAAQGEQPLERWWQPAPRETPKPEPVLAAHLQEQQEARDGANGAARPSTFDVLGGRTKPAGASQPGAAASGARSAAAGPRTAEAPPPRAAEAPRQPWFSKRWWNILIWVGVAATLVRLPWPLALSLVVVGAIAFLAIRAWGRK
jgi:RNA-directed DNA polymerase